MATEEAAAALRKAVAEGDWRCAWWGTTVGLGALPMNGVGRELARIAPVLGCSPNWLGQRRSLGAKIDPDLDPALRATVPPRLAIEYVRGGRILDAAAASFLVQWESDERSLRELAAELGTAGRSWASKEQLDEREAASRPTVEQIRAALADPETAREVVAHGPTRGNFQSATDSWARANTATTQWAPLPTNVTTTEAMAKVFADVLRARELMHATRAALADLALDGQQLEQLLARVQDVGDEATLVRELLHGQVRFAADMQQLGVQR